MALFDSIFNTVKTFLGPLGTLFDHLKSVYVGITNVYSDADKLATSIRDEIDAWRNFKQDIRIRQRVVQVERAIEKTRDLIEGIPAAWRALLDIISEIKSQIAGQENPIEEAESTVEDIESSGGISGILSKFPAFARALEKLLGVLALIVTALESISKGIADIQTIVDELKAIRLEIEKLDTIFLSQSNKRKTLKLADGSTIRVRVGNLHS
jgi:hypothetical protein